MVDEVKSKNVKPLIAHVLLQMFTTANILCAYQSFQVFPS